MTRWYQTSLIRGRIDKDFTIKYLLSYDDSGDYQTIKESDDGANIRVRPSFLLRLDKGFGKESLLIPSALYFQFVSLLKKSIKQISESLYDLFPDIGQTEFTIDTKTLERFQTEKALSTAGMSIVPCVYANEQNECFPGIMFNSTNGSIRIPFEDAITASEMFSHLDPITLQFTILSMIGRFN